MLLETWEGQDHPFVNCLDPNEMEYYRVGAYSVIYWYMGGHAPGYEVNPAGKMFEMCEMWSDVLTNTNSTANNIHGIQIHYGDYIP